MSKKKTVENGILELCPFESDLVIVARQKGNSPATIARFATHPIRNAADSIEWLRTYLRCGEPIAGTRWSDFEFCLRVYLKEQERRPLGQEIKATKIIIRNTKRVHSISIIEIDQNDIVLFIASNTEPDSVRTLGEILSKVFEVPIETTEEVTA